VEEMEVQMPKWWTPTMIGGEPFSIKTAKTMYVDDHMEIHKFYAADVYHDPVSGLTQFVC
jgi:hypothetical protein